LNTEKLTFVCFSMKVIRLTTIGLALAACMGITHAQDTTTQTVNSSPARPESEPPLSYAPPTVTESQPNFYNEFFFEANGDHRFTLNGDYESLTQNTFSGLWSFTRHDYFGVSLGMGVFQLKHGSFADSVAHQPFAAETGFVLRHYFTSPNAFLRPYASANAGIIWTIWDYRHPIHTHDGTISTDETGAIDASAGLGLLIQVHENINLFAEGNIGGIAFPDVTANNVNNNFFSNTAYIGAKAGLSFSF
jgi:hypothetical protein